MPNDTSGFKRFRIRSRVDELPPEARELIDAMLLSQDPYYTYQDIADAVAETGCTISKSSIGRYVSRQHEQARETEMLAREMDALLRWSEGHPDFDIAAASLSMLISRMSRRVINEPDMLNDLSADKLAARIIQATRTRAMFEKISTDREDDKSAAKAAVMDELREALHSEPELFGRLQELVAGREEAGG